MKLYTICPEKESLFKNIDNLNFEEYTMADYNKFVEEVKKYYISSRFYWYETDMSDSDSGTVYRSFPINYTNMIIKDNELYGVLVNTNGIFKEHYVLKLKDKHVEAHLGGGYEVLDYDWDLKEKDSSKPYLIDISQKYVMVYETFSYLKGKLSLYRREIVGFFPIDCILKDDKVIGLKYRNSSDELDFLFDDRKTYTHKIVTGDDSSKTVRLFTFVEVNEEFLEKNILKVTSSDFSKGNFKFYGNIED